MDTLTHALSGALLARATEPRQPRPDQLPRRLRMWVGFWTAAFPDSDYVVSFFDQFTYLTAHRGVTHSLVLLPLWAIGLAFLFSLIGRGRYSWKAFVGMCALGIGAHIAGDVITSFGTMIFAPFSNWRASLPATFIIDFYFSGIIAVGLIASAYWKTTRTAAVAALALLISYVGLQLALHQRAVGAGEAYIAANKMKSAQAEALPQPLSPFNWMIVIAEPDNYYLSYVSLARNEAPASPAPDSFWLQRVSASYRPITQAEWQKVPRYGTRDSDVELAMAAWNSDSLARYRHFVMFPALYRIDRDASRTCVWFNDLRFIIIGRTTPFRYGACRPSLPNKNTAWQLYRLIADQNGRDFPDAIPN